MPVPSFALQPIWRKKSFRSLLSIYFSNPESCTLLKALRAALAKSNFSKNVVTKVTQDRLNAIDSAMLWNELYV